MELLIGCGNRWVKKVKLDETPESWTELITLDIDPDCGASVIHDLTDLPLPFNDDTFDEIHAYDILEHTGSQGDWRFFFNQFYEFWRILKPGGTFHGLTPAWHSIYAFGDPGHTRIISENTLVFLSQKEYQLQVGKSSMTDYRHYWEGDFDICALNYDENENCMGFVLKAVK